MRVIYCITRSDTLGGAHIHVGDLAAWMRSKGYDASVVVGGEGPFCDHLSRKGVPYSVSKNLCRSIRVPSDVRALMELRKIFRQSEPDLLSLHSAKAGMLGRVAACGLDFPVVFTAHGWSFTEGVSKSRARVFKALEKMVAPLADCVITVSDYDRDLALRAGVGKANRMYTVHNAMHDDCAPSKARDQSGPLTLTMVARLDEQKDHRTLLAALATLTNQDWVLNLVGDGPLEGQVKEDIDRLGLTDRVRLLGLRSDVDQILADSHIFVLTSHWEGFPRSILEAMRAALPVVASDVGGVSEAVVDGETGYLVPPEDVTALTRRLTHLIGDSAARGKLGDEGRHRFERLFRFERMAEETLAIYEEVWRRRSCACA